MICAAPVKKSLSKSLPGNWVGNTYILHDFTQHKINMHEFTPKVGKALMRKLTSSQGWHRHCKFHYLYKIFTEWKSRLVKIVQGIQKTPLFPCKMSLNLSTAKIIIGISIFNSAIFARKWYGNVFCQNQFCKQARVQTGLWLRKTEICQNLILVNKKWVINFKWGQNPLFEMAVDKSRDFLKGRDHFYWIPRKK